MDTETLRLFVLAAERLNITAAGRELGLAPAVASTRLAKLERALGVELLHRTTRKISLSLEGTEFLPYAREILAQEDAALAALGYGGAEPTGVLRFAAPSSFAQLHIMPILPEFTALHPSLTLDLRLSDKRFDLIEGSFDLALRSAPMTDSSLKGRKLADDTRILCASPEYLARNGTPEQPEDLYSHQLIAWVDLAERRLIDRKGTPWTLDPKRCQCRVIVDDGASQRIATLAGVGISINSLWSVGHEIEAGRMAHVLPDWRLDDRSALWLVYPRSNVLTAKTRLFMDFLLSRIGGAQAWTA